MNLHTLSIFLPYVDITSIQVLSVQFTFKVVPFQLDISTPLYRIHSCRVHFHLALPHLNITVLTCKNNLVVNIMPQGLVGCTLILQRTISVFYA